MLKFITTSSTDGYENYGSYSLSAPRCVKNNQIYLQSLGLHLDIYYANLDMYYANLDMYYANLDIECANQDLYYAQS